MAIYSPGHIYHLNNVSFYENKLSEGQKLLGVIINGKFSICREFISEQGCFVYGYLAKEPSSENRLSIQTVTGFNDNKFDQYNSEYCLGDIVFAFTA